MIRISLFFTFFITIVHSIIGQSETLNLFVIKDQQLFHELHSTPYKPQIMALPVYGEVEWLGGDSLLGVLGDNTLIYTPYSGMTGHDELKIGYWQMSNFGPVFNQRIIKIFIEEGGNIIVNVNYDENDSCQREAHEMPLSNRSVRIFNESIEVIRTTNSNGKFTIDLPDGAYEVNYLDDNPNWRACTNLPPLVIDNEAITLDYDLPVQAVSTQPYLTVDLATPFLRRCFSNTYTISYCNESTVSIENPYVEIILDPFLEYEGATLTLIEQRGDTLRFNLPELAIDECGRFHLFAKVSCDATLGQTHCTTANIYPQPEIPLVARLQVTGDCYGDKMVFVIKNIGDVDMEDTVEYFVIEDQVVYLKEDILLEMGDSVIISRPADGQTVRVEVAQTADFLYEKTTSKTIEACSNHDNTDVSLGFVNQFSQPDEAPFTAMDCQENRGSYDPNDKQAFPTGVTIGENNFIYKNTDLEYLIRFQNTGTDTAFTVIIKDTLSQNLALKTLQIGAASHDFTWQLLPDRTLQFSFDNILLPDSTTNEEASHGFIQFRIAQKIDLPVNSEINNHAAIFFDFNAPIITNTVRHTISEKFLNTYRPERPTRPNIEVSTVLSSINVFPNPASDKVYFQIPTIIRKPAYLFIFNSKMQEKVRHQIDNELFGIDTQKWERGLYFWVLDDGKNRWNGRVVIDK